MAQYNKQRRREDERLLTILPSYQMYRSIVSKPLVATNEDLRSEPPSYDVTPASTHSTESDYFGGVSLVNSPAQEDNEPFISWEDTILANSHKLKKLTSANRLLASKLEVKIHFTEELGMVGVPSVIIDPLSVEYEQGDVINGYVTIINRMDHRVPFDMFAVALEGTTILGESKRPVMHAPQRVERFLNMFDFNASYNDGTLDRLVTEHNNPHVHLTRLDPIDNTQVFLDNRMVFEPGITYKKFFTFKIPDRLLDYSCAPHGLLKHMQLPVTLGVSKSEILAMLRAKWLENSDRKPDDTMLLSDHPDSKYASQTTDFASDDMSISYCITAKIIGRAIEYEKIANLAALDIKKVQEEYVVANEANCFIRVIPKTELAFELNRAMINREARLLYESLVAQTEAKLAQAKLMSQNPQPENDDDDQSLQPSSSVTEMQKLQQSYYSQTKSRLKVNDKFEVYHKCKKRNILGHSKEIGLMALSAPRKEAQADYVPLKRYATGCENPIVKLPLELSFVPSGNNEPSQIIGTSVQLISTTITTKSLPIPVVLHPDMLFRNEGRETDNFEHITVKRFQQYAMELSRYMRELGSQALGIDKSMILDIKSLANLKTKYHTLKLSRSYFTVDGKTFASLSDIPYKEDSNATLGPRLSKSFVLNVDMSLARVITPNTPHPEEFCLVPDFQSCYIARLYFFKISLKLSTGEKLSIKVPVNLQKYPRSLAGNEF